MRWRVSWLGALVGVVALLGCSSTQVDDFLHDGNAICAGAQKRLGKHPKPSSPAEIAKEVKHEIEVREAAIAELEELGVPMNISGATAVVDHLIARQERARAIEKAAKKEQLEKLRKLEEHDHKEHEVEAAHARELGLHRCAEL